MMQDVMQKAHQEFIVLAVLCNFHCSESFDGLTCTQIIQKAKEQFCLSQAFSVSQEVINLLLRHGAITSFSDASATETVYQIEEEYRENVQENLQKIGLLCIDIPTEEMTNLVDLEKLKVLSFFNEQEFRCSLGDLPHSLADCLNDTVEHTIRVLVEEKCLTCSSVNDKEYMITPYGKKILSKAHMYTQPKQL